MQDSDLEGREGVLEGGERRDDSGLPLHIPDFTGQDIFLSKTQFLFAWETQFFVCVENLFFCFFVDHQNHMPESRGIQGRNHTPESRGILGRGGEVD